MLLLEIGADMSVFGSAERLASWVGSCQGNNESAGKRKTGRIRKGNAWVRRLLCEFAQAASRTRGALRGSTRWPSARAARSRSSRWRTRCCAPSTPCWPNGTPYKDKEVDYEALNVQRNAPRWVKMLKKHGFVPTPTPA